MTRGERQLLMAMAETLLKERWTSTLQTALQECQAESTEGESVDVNVCPSCHGLTCFAPGEECMDSVLHYGTVPQ